LKIILCTLLLLFTCKAQVLSSIGTAEPSYSKLDEAIDDAKQNLIKSYTTKHYSDIMKCLDSDFMLDEDDFDIEIIREKELNLSPKHLVINVEFEIIEKTSIRDTLNTLCQEKKDAHQQSIRYAKMRENFYNSLSNFHFGVGVYGWAESQGIESIFSFETTLTSLYLTAAYQSVFSSGTSEKPTPHVINSNAKTVGTEMQFPISNIFEKNPNEGGLLLGYDFYVEQSEHEFISESATASYTWGGYYKAGSKKWEIAIIFKHFNDVNQNDQSVMSGGLRVRYKFF